jgi:hypothetical protein
MSTEPTDYENEAPTKDPHRGDATFKVVLALLIAGGILYFGTRKQPAPPPPAPAAATPAPIANPVQPPTSKSVQWTATGNAYTMTGPVSTSASTLTLLRQNYPLHITHPFTSSEMLTAANLFTSTTPPGSTANVYQVNIPATVQLNDKHPLCPNGPAQWLIALTTADAPSDSETLSLAFYSGPTPPPLNPATIGDAPDSCGTFTYTRRVH